MPSLNTGSYWPLFVLNRKNYDCEWQHLIINSITSSPWEHPNKYSKRQVMFMSTWLRKKPLKQLAKDFLQIILASTWNEDWLWPYHRYVMLWFLILGLGSGHFQLISANGTAESWKLAWRNVQKVFYYTKHFLTEPHRVILEFGETSNVEKLPPVFNFSHLSD